MRSTFTLSKAYRGFDEGTEFERVAAYGPWHVASMKLESTDSLRRVEVTTEELEQFFAA